MASKSKFEDLDLSKDEIKRIGDALKDEKFRKMFMEYAEELQDPENKRLYEEEIAKMEKERGMNVTFVRPEPGYVLKTSVNGEKKAFINISKSDKVDKPKSERKESENGKNGLLWHIPHSFAPPREDQDKEKNRCQVFDFVVHPDTLRMAESNARFKQMVEDTAMEGIEKQFEVKLDRKNVKRPKMKFKGTPSATVIRTRSEDGPQVAPDESGILKDMPYPYDDKTTEEKMKEREKNISKKKGSSKNKDSPDEAFVPKYTITHRSDFDMQDFCTAPDTKINTRPRELVIKIELPLLKSAAQANLDIFERKLVLESKTPVAYKLDLSLPYPVDDSEGSAKFDKQKRTLTVSLPVLPDGNSLTTTDWTNGSITSEHETELIREKPLIEVLSSETNGGTPSNAVKQNDVLDYLPEPTTSKVDKIFATGVSYSLPEISFTQDSETVSMVLKVKNVVEDSIRRVSPTTDTVQLVCTSQGEGGFPLHYSLFLRFAHNCRIVPEHCSIDVTADNVVLLLLKERASRGLWDRFWMGMNSQAQDLKEQLFLTVNNLQQQLGRLDRAAAQVEQTAAPSDLCDPRDAGHPHCDLEVTAMTQHKLTVKICPAKKSARPEAAAAVEEEEEEGYDPPSSAEIEVVHSRPSPSLHGILKQRTVSESSEDVSHDPDSPRSPGQDDDDPLSSSWKRRSVSFSQRVQQATFKTSAAVTSMTPALKSQRRRQRKQEERKDKASARRRNNSQGSEGSGDDHATSLSDSHSPSEEELGDQLATEMEMGKQEAGNEELGDHLATEVEISKHPAKKEDLATEEESDEHLAPIPSDSLSGEELEKGKERESTGAEPQSVLDFRTDTDSVAGGEPALSWTDSSASPDISVGEKSAVSDETNAEKSRVRQESYVEKSKVSQKNCVEKMEESNVDRNEESDVEKSEMCDEDENEGKDSGSEPHKQEEEIRSEKEERSSEAEKSCDERKGDTVVSDKEAAETTPSPPLESQDARGAVKPPPSSTDAVPSNGIAAKVKSKLAESPATDDAAADSDDDDDNDARKGDAQESSGSQPYNEHRTQCAFNFSNTVIFDLDDQ